MTFQQVLEQEWIKHQKRTKVFLWVAGLSTVFLCLFPILAAALVDPDQSPTVFNIVMWFGTVPTLGFLTWPFVFFHRRKKSQAQKTMENIPAPGKDRLHFAIGWYEKQKWERLPSESQEEQGVRLRQKRRFNLLLALFALLFGFLFVSWRRPATKVKLELIDDGSVMVHELP